MSKSPFLLGMLSLFALLFVASCKEPAVKEEPIQKNVFVRAWTTGQVSSGSAVRIVFDLPDEYLHFSNETPPEDVFELTPATKGKTFWASNYTLIFKPETSLKNGTKYKVVVDLEKLLGIHGKDRKFTFYIDVIPLEFTVETDNLKAYNNSDMQWNYLSGRIISSDDVTGEYIKTLLTAGQQGKKLNIKFNGQEYGTVFSFVIDSVERRIKESSLMLKWQGDKPVRGFDEDDELKVRVPALHYFDLVKIEVDNTPDQFLTVEFTDPVDPAQNLDGLIYFDDKSEVRLSIEGNTVLVTPAKRLVGEKNIHIQKKILSVNGKSLPGNIIRAVYFEQIKPDIRFTSSGVIMPGEDGWLLPFEAVNLKAVDVLIKKIYAKNVQQFLQVNDLSGSYQLHRVGELIHHEKVLLAGDNGEVKGWKAYAIDLSKMIEKEPGAVYRVEFRYKKSYVVNICGGSAVPENDQDEEVTEDYYNDDYYYPPDFKWRDRDDPCKDSYYYSNRFKARNVLASNIGLTVKENGGRFVVFAHDLITARPMTDVRLELYNYQQRELCVAKTDNEGKAVLTYQGEPYLLVAEKSGQFAYQRLDGGSALSYSKFDTKGVDVSRGIKAFIYGERGVWRPGDTLFLTVIVDDHDNPLPDGHPVKLKLTGPRGTDWVKKKSINGKNGFYSFCIPTNSNFPTGFWKATAEVGGAEFTRTIRLETIKPNRLKIELTLQDSILREDNNNGVLNVRWLHGGIASGLKADVNVTVRQTKTVFANYEGFNFDDPARSYPPEELTVFEGKLNEWGRARFDFDLPPAKMAPGMLKVNFSTKVYERGGDFSIDQKSASYAPFPYYIGLKKPDPGKNRYLEVDKEQVFEVATVSETGEPISKNDLEYVVYKLDWSWWYGSNSRNLAYYIDKNYNRIVKRGNVTTRNGKGSFAFKLNYPEWGWFYIMVQSKNGGHRTGMKVYYDWPVSYARKNRFTPGSANLLSLSTDKDKYMIGETVKVSVPTPQNARLLVTVEKGNKQFRMWQMDAEGKETVISFEATADMTPNVYLYVSVLQPHNQTVNDLPIRMYGVTPIMVEDRKTVLEPVLDVPETIRPNEKYTVKVSEKNHRKMTYTIAVVDEGLLDLTHFKTPSPHRYFYAKEALAVKTWDIYDQVMGAFGRRLEKIFAIGGDMEMQGDEGKKKANRFKPVVTYLGPFLLEEGAANSHQIQMPNYVGSVRCMVVAGEEGAYGETEQTFTVKQPLMVLGTLPRVLAPGEKVKLPVSVFVMDDKIKNVSVHVETNEFFVKTKADQSVQIPREGEHMAYFDLETVDRQGVAKVKIVVKSGGEQAEYEMELQVRNPNPRIYKVTYQLLKPGEKWQEEIEPFGTPGTNEINLTVSTFPPVNLERRLSYLVRYPYGCIEQTTSSVFPQLFLSQLMDIEKEKQLDMENNIKKGIERIILFQLNNGGFSYWPGGVYANDWGTSYAGHFLLLAKEKGYYVSQTILDKWMQYQKMTANNWTYVNYEAFNQAYRLYTLALAGKPNLSAMNRLRSFDNLPAQAKYRLAAAYAVIGRKEIAAKLLDGVMPTYTKDTEYWHWSYGSVLRDKAFNLETYLLMGEEEKALNLFIDITDNLKSDKWMSTQTTAFALYAVSLLVNENDRNAACRFSYEWNGHAAGIMDIKTAVYSTGLEIKNTNKLAMENLSDNNLFMTITSSGIPLRQEEVHFEQNLNLQVKYYDMNGKSIDISRLSHGMDFYAEITVSNPGNRGWLKNLALTQIFPSGWEIINTRMLDLGSSLASDKSDYIDFRDDRVDIFFGLGANQKKRFVILLNASYLGEFYLPVSRCADMYDNTINAAIGGGWVKVSN